MTRCRMTLKTVFSAIRAYNFVYCGFTGVHPFYNCHEPSRDSLLDMPHSSDSTRYLRALARRRRGLY